MITLYALQAHNCDQSAADLYRFVLQVRHSLIATDVSPIRSSSGSFAFTGSAARRALLSASAIPPKHA